MADTTLWREAAPLLLASTSATRRTLLEAAGVPVESEAPDVDERAIESGVLTAGMGTLNQPLGLAKRLAREKALAVSRRHPGRIVVGADQTLACDGKLFHRPADRGAAEAQLVQLAGRIHTLHAGFAVVREGTVLHEGADTARLTMRKLEANQIAAYVDLAGGCVTASVGAYQVEGLGIHLFERIEGEHSTILGLPLLPLLAALRRLGVMAL
jgi:septum formation protein